MKKLILLSIIVFYVLSLNAQVYNVGHTSMSFIDPARSNRDVTTEVYYPAVTAGEDVAAANGVFPYIVFGHGFIMSDGDYLPLSDVLVSKGYIVIFVTTCETIVSSDHETFGIDLAFVCGQFYYLNTNPSSLFLGKIIDKKAIMGHSMGGGSTVLAAQNNANINTIICLSPMDTDPSAIAAAHLVNIPALIICAGGDSVCPAPSMGKPIYDSLASSCKVFLSLTGGGHCLYGGSNGACELGESVSGSDITITREQQQDLTLDFITPWLNYYLKNDFSSNVLFFDSLQASSRVTFMNECITTGISEQMQNENFSLYPNPANNFIIVESVSKSEIEIITIEGQIIESLETVENTATIDISAFAKGIYYVKIISKAIGTEIGFSVKKFIKL